MPSTRILFVEDDETIAELMDMALCGAGYKVDLVGTVALAHQRLASFVYGLVITDWRLPDGNGASIADRAAELGVKAVIVSGYVFNMPAETASRHEVLMKPIRPSELVAVVRGLIGPAEAAENPN